MAWKPCWFRIKIAGLGGNISDERHGSESVKTCSSMAFK